MKRKFYARVIVIGIVMMSLASTSVFAFRSKSNYTIPDGLDLTAYELIDGTYTGTADGFRPGLVVEVEIENGKLVDIEIVEHNEVGRRYYQYPMQVIPEDIIAQQSTDLDAVSGATCTSDAIMAAVEDAVKKASAN